MQALIALVPLGLLLIAAAAASSSSSSPAEPRPAGPAPVGPLPITNVSDKPQRRGKAPSREPEPKPRSKPKPGRAAQTLENVAIAVTETVMRKLDRDKQKPKPKPKPTGHIEPGQVTPRETPAQPRPKPKPADPRPAPMGTPLEQRIAAGAYMARMATGRNKPGPVIRFYQRLMGVPASGQPDQHTHNAAMLQIAKVKRVPSPTAEVAVKAARRLLALPRSTTPNARVLVDQLAISMPPEEWDGILGKRTHEAARLVVKPAAQAAQPAQAQQPKPAQPAQLPAGPRPSTATVNVPVAAAKELATLLDSKQVRSDQHSEQVRNIQRLMGLKPEEQDGLAGARTQWRMLELLEYPKSVSRSQVEAANTFAGKMRKKEIQPKRQDPIVRELQRRMGMAAAAQDGYAGPQTQAWALRVLQLGTR